MIKKSTSNTSSTLSGQPVKFGISPLLASKTPMWRSRVALCILGLAFLGLGARAAYVQVIHQDFYQKQGEIRFSRTVEVPAKRGQLLDRQKQLLASNTPATSVWAIPEDINQSLKKSPEKLPALAKVLDMPLADVQKKLAQEDRAFVWLKRQLDAGVNKELQALQLEGLHTVSGTRRHYADGESVAQIMGAVNNDGKGIEGLELVFDEVLSGQNGSRRVMKDRIGRVVEQDDMEHFPPIDGHDVQLTIDSKIQFFAYQKLKDAVTAQRAKSGSVVVLDAQTNHVLALANYEAPTGKSSQSPIRNRALVDSFEPGSVMKPLTIAVALERGLVTPRTMFQTAPGFMMVTGAKITDSHPHGMLSVEQIIQKSSNVGTVKIAQLIAYKDMWDFYRLMGLGQKPVLPYPGVVSGKLRAYQSWRPVEQATMSYGYGLSVSLFQLAQAYSVLANDGELITPRIVVSDEPVMRQRIFSAANARAVRQMLHLATGAGGTAPKAQVEGYTVGGKTGTAHKQERRGYASNKYRSTFVGMAPIEAPRIVVAVSIDEPSNGKYFGGEVAAPVFSQTVEQALRVLGVPPDRAVKPQIDVTPTKESI